MDMHAAQHVAAADHLQIVHDIVVALAFRLARALPHRGRMGAGGENGKAVLGSDIAKRRAQMAQFGARRRDIVMRLRHDLDLRLQEFAGDAVAQAQCVAASRKPSGILRATDLLSRSTRKYSSSIPKENGIRDLIAFHQPARLRPQSVSGFGRDRADEVQGNAKR